MPSHWFVLLPLLAQIPGIEVPIQTQYTARFSEIRAGTGDLAQPGKVFVVHYTVWLPDGKKLDSSYDRNAPFQFEQGRRRVIPGWEAGFEGMRIGGKRRMFIPYQLAYGEKGRGEIPPKADLVFDVELLEVREPVALRRATAPAGSHYEGISAALPTGSPAISSEALVAAYDMQTLTGGQRLRDFSKNGNHGMVSGTGSVTGIFGEARRFAEAMDRVALASSPSLAMDGPLSIAVWVRLTKGGLHQHFFACDDKFALWLSEDNKLRFSDTTGHGFQSFDEVSQGEWHSIVATYRGTKGAALTSENLTVFLNGREMDGRRDAAWSPGELHAKDACYIGFAGEIDELLVFGRGLSDAEAGVFSAKGR